MTPLPDSRPAEVGEGSSAGDTEVPEGDHARETVEAERLAGIQAILFDLDGTLIDTIELIRISFRHATKTVLGHELPDEVTMRNVGQPLIEQFRDMAPEHAEELLAVYREYNHRRHDELAREYPGTLETLEKVRRKGLPMGIVTSKGTVAATMGVDRFGLREYMDVIVTADDVERHKPDPYPVRFAASQLGADIGYCMYVGDSPHDMQSAVAAGAISVAALWGAFPAEEVLVCGTQFALESINELTRLLDGDVERFRVRGACGPAC
jgi:pyrophosphatase PpaX